MVIDNINICKNFAFKQEKDHKQQSMKISRFSSFINILGLNLLPTMWKKRKNDQMTQGGGRGLPLCHVTLFSKFLSHIFAF
jgi:hypothetical protein